MEATDPEVWIRMIASFVKATLNPHVPRMFSLDRISKPTIATFSCTVLSLCSFHVTSIPFQLISILIPYTTAVHVSLAINPQLLQTSLQLYMFISPLQLHFHSVSEFQGFYILQKVVSCMPNHIRIPYHTCHINLESRTNKLI